MISYRWLGLLCFCCNFISFLFLFRGCDTLVNVAGEEVKLLSNFMVNGRPHCPLVARQRLTRRVDHTSTCFCLTPSQSAGPSELGGVVLWGSPFGTMYLKSPALSFVSWVYLSAVSDLSRMNDAQRSMGGRWCHRTERRHGYINGQQTYKLNM